MRVGVAGPYHSIPQGTPQPCSRYIKVHLLVGNPLYFLVEPKSRTKELYTELCGYLKGQGMLDTDLFGLSLMLDGEYIFVEPDYKLSKYAPKSWRSSSSNGLDNTGKPLLEFYLQVQFYVESPLLLQDELSIEHYYTQIQKNVLERGLLHPSASHQALFILAGLALQAQHGDSSQPEYYTKPQNYLPQQLVNSCGVGRLTQTFSSLHRANNGITQTQARIQYIREASSLDTSAIPHNTHVYRLRCSKAEAPPGSVVLAVCTKGIELYQENAQKPINGKFLWNDIGKLCFDRKKFEIRGVNWPSNEKYVYYTTSDEKSKHLLSLCKVTHQYSMAIQPRLAQVRGREESERKQCREWPMEICKYQNRYGGTGEQRISVISSTSSTTTSGIVSDRVHSLDESEDDLELEIMINSPPAPSVESLALAHLCESAQTSPSPQSSNDIKQGIDCIDGPVVSPVAMTPATTDGSQCSSSASTVVIQKQQQSVDNMNNNSMVVRCESVTSSLELGYSHTAQHSALSESCELDYSVQSAHASSGVYTLDGNSDNHTVIETVASSSGIGLESQGQRSRSGSIVSNNGSFHGDGSDPSDAGRGNLLSAEELSNLIVHRSPKPRRGVYPTRATVSSTLDSCSDYVTLPPPPIPPPPIPPPRMDSDKSYVMLEPPKPQGYYSSQNMVPRLVIPPQQYQYFPDIMHPLNSLPSPTTEEASARFITTKPQINVLTARTGYVQSSPSFSSPPNSRFDPSSRMKLNSNMIPIVGSNNYLDVRGSYLQQQYHHQSPPPHLVHARQPPPPPPPPPPRPNLATVYTSQVTRSQIEQFKQQLYSDADYVMYPMQDPAISKQEYLDSKLALGYRHMPPPPYPAKNIMYRSTPNVAVASGYIPFYNKQLTHNKFASNQNLSDYYPQSFLSNSPLYSAAASYSSSSTHSLRFDPLHQIIPPVALPSQVHRTLSDDNILNCERPLDRTKYRRPPPPVPPLEPLIVSEQTSAGLASSSIKPSPSREVEKKQKPDSPLDISSLREKSRNLDLPLISALCNDKSLLKQTNAFVMPRHPGNNGASATSTADGIARGIEKRDSSSKRPVSWHIDSRKNSTDLSPIDSNKKSIFSTLLAKSVSNPTTPTKNSKLKYPVSGLSTNQIVKANRKTISRHKHPETKVQTKINRSQSTGGTTSSKDVSY
ncbi:protein expanded-like [Rhodnius prolixus]|uniref:protein expanded-like n=1 Tax=Rhodnius prolixus TaxID=13249 RepID=UPI003D18EECB